MRHLPPNRRRILGLGGRLAAAALTATAPLSLLSTSEARGAVADSPRFALTGPDEHPVLRARLHRNWVMQSFAYDNTRQEIYFVQHVPDTSDPARTGDLYVTRTDAAGAERGWMALIGFGHGVQIAVEPRDDGVWLWTEWRADDSGYGTRLARFPFRHEATIGRDDPLVQDRTPALPGVVRTPQPAIDPSTGRLLVRYKDARDRPRVAVFALADARGRRPAAADRLVDRPLPYRGDWAGDHPFQGFTAYGRYLYQLEGGLGGPAHLTAVDLVDTSAGPVADRVVTRAGSFLPDREPQGMAVWLSPRGPRLAFGFHSNANGQRYASVFCKRAFA
jgi:hypothetical protein